PGQAPRLGAGLRRRRRDHARLRPLPRHRPAPPGEGAGGAAGPAETFATFGRAFWSYLQQDKIALVLLFILTYKIGDEILFSMNSAFLMRELHVTKGQLSWLAGVVGAGTTIAGAMAGSYWIRRKGL